MSGACWGILVSFWEHARASCPVLVHLGQCSFSLAFRMAKMARLGSILASQMETKVFQNGFKNRFIFGCHVCLILEQFRVLFWDPKSYEILQNGFRKRLKKARIAKRCIFETMCFVLFFATNLEHRASQERPKNAQKPPLTTPKSLQELVQKRVQFWSVIYMERCTKNVLQNGAKHARKGS